MSLGLLTQAHKAIANLADGFRCEFDCSHVHKYKKRICCDVSRISFTRVCD
jgi:hypothetical protein